MKTVSFYSEEEQWLDGTQRAFKSQGLSSRSAIAPTETYFEIILADLWWYEKKQQQIP